MKPLEKEKIIEICKLIARPDISLRSIGKIMNVSTGTIYRILNREIYVEISKDYSFMHRITALHCSPGFAGRIIRLLETEKYAIVDIAKYLNTDVRLIARIESERKKMFVPTPQDQNDTDHSHAEETIPENASKRRLPHVITSDSPSGAVWKSIIVDGAKSKYECDVNGFVRNTRRGNLLKGKKSFRNMLYLLEINNHKVSIQRKRLIASLWVPIPEKYKDVDVRLMEVYHKNADNNDFSLDNIKWYYRGDSTLDREDLPYYLRYTMNDKSKAIDLLKQGEYKIKEISNLTDIGRSSLGMLSCGKIWYPGIEDVELPSRTIRSCDPALTHKICKDLQDGMKVCDISKKIQR